MLAVVLISLCLSHSWICFIGTSCARRTEAQVVEADLLQIMLLQELSEVSGDEVGIIQPPEGIHANVSLSPLLLSPSSFSLITIGGFSVHYILFFKNFQNHIDNPLFLCYTIIG